METYMANKKGSICISDEVLMDLAGYAALESYGVVGMANQSLVDDVVQLLPRNKLHKGVRISLADEKSETPGAVNVDLYVVIEYGTNLSQVSHNLSDRVRYTLTEFADIEVGRVEVHVLEVRVR